MTREEAINLVKQVLPCLNVDEKIREGFKTLIPELRESEDERIRKSIIHILQVGGYMSPEEKDKAFAYLEKQKEQKPLTAEETELNSIAFLEQMGYTCIPPGKEQRLTESRKRNKPKESWLSKAKYEIEHADELLRQSQEELKEIRELKKQEQKPICDIASDDAIESCMLRYLQSAANRKDDIEIIEDTKAYKSELISIIKKEQKPVEWSEEDEKMLTELLLTIEPSNNYDEMRNWLLLKLKALLLQGSKDSLQTSWKPSEEQMKALCSKLPVVKGRGDKVQDILETLYYDLKKRGVKEEPDC